MGEVYKARDTRLDRTVAVKIVPEHVATDPELKQRFEREAKALAALNHPHICHIHDVGNQDGIDFLVMEHLEGETLAERLGKGALPLDQALRIAIEIADALDKAHRKGIVHRDLKPGNVMLTKGGAKLLDFGLAKLRPTGPTGSVNVSATPTVSSPLTRAGSILGTFQYMAPEQLEGQEADARTDIFAFGAVVYEMVTGKRAFEGKSQASLIAAILERDPAPLSILQPVSPPALERVVTKCLAKDPDSRWHSAHDLHDELQWVAGAGSHLGVVTPAVTAPRRQSGWRLWPLALASLVTAGASGLVGWGLWPSAAPEAPVRFDYALPDGQQLFMANRPAVAVSPDGRWFLYQTTQGLYLRSMGELEARLIQGTDGRVTSPFFSPDSQWVGFGSFNDGERSGGVDLKKVAVAGGAPMTLCHTDSIYGASWAPDDTILFGQPTGIMRVSANGGTPELVVRAGAGEQIYGPQLLPGGHSILFSATTDTEPGSTRWARGQVVVQALSSGTRTVVVQNGSDARYLATGHLVYVSRDTLFGVAFTPDRPTTATGAVPLVRGIQLPVSVITAGTNYTVSDQGTLVYVPATEASHSLVWVNRNGTPAGRVESIPAGPYDWPRLSTDGRRVLVTRDNDIWVYDLGSGRSNRLTRDGSSLMGVWDPADAQVAYSSATGGNLEAWVRPADGSGEPRQLTHLGGQVHVDSWSPDGRTLTIHHHSPEGPTRMFALPMGRADPSPQPLSQEGRSAEGADFSRDGRYIAYLSGQEVYLKPYPGPGGEQTVSVAGGREPVWAANGDVFYRSLTGERMFAVSITTEPVLNIGTPVELFQGPYYVSPTGSPRAQYDVTPDGQRFLMLVPGPGASGSSTRPRVVVVLNWFEELKRLVPVQ
jgi:eukaryotic-like serine/threonine-protein kinase